MKMRFKVNPHIIAVIENEWSQMIRNRVVVFTTFAPPFLFVALALTVLYLSTWIEVNYDTVERVTDSIASSVPGLPPLSHLDTVRASLLSPFLLLFLMLPLVVPITVASYSIVGEKQSRSLETLLATPIKTWELLTAKALAAAIPGIAATWSSFAVFLLASRIAVSPVLYNNLVLSSTWLVAITLLTPVLTMFAVSLGIIISSRVKDPQSAQQLGSLVVLPMIAVMVGQVLGAVNVDAAVVMNTVVTMAVVDLALLGLAVRLFRREKILTGWR